MTLYIVATPIGNLEDITLRAIRVLKEVALVVAEDTRTTRKLLSHLDIHVPTLSYEEHSAAERIPRILDALASGDVALVSEAGMPLISDPGHMLVTAAVQRGIRVEAIPGASAVPTALAVAGMPADRFTFLGFLPRQQSERQALLRSVAMQPWPLVIFESPHRLGDSLADLLAVLGDRPMAVCRELTKLHEEVFRGPISAAILHFTEPRGEFVFVVSGAEPLADTGVDEDTVRRELAALKLAGRTSKEAIEQVTATLGVSRRDAYRLWLELSK